MSIFTIKRKTVAMEEIKELISDWSTDYPYDQEEDFVSVFNYKYKVEHFIFDGTLVIKVLPNTELIIVKDIQKSFIKINGHTILLSEFLKKNNCDISNNIQSVIGPDEGFITINFDKEEHLREFMRLYLLEGEK